MNPARARCTGRTLMLCAGLAAGLGSASVSAWEDRTAGTDMPWMGGGGRAHPYFDRSACFGCPTGYKDRERWGRSRWSGEDPYVTVSKAMSFLVTAGGMGNAARSIGAGTIGVEGGTIEPRAIPYHLTVVMIEPTIVVMNFDLGALIHQGEPQHGQVVGTPYTDGTVSYGTRIPATGTLLWFAPNAKIAPTPVAGQASGRGEINVGRIRVSLERQKDEWVVSVR